MRHLPSSLPPLQALIRQPAATVPTTARMTSLIEHQTLSPMPAVIGRSKFVLTRPPGGPSMRCSPNRSAMVQRTLEHQTISPMPALIGRSMVVMTRPPGGSSMRPTILMVSRPTTHRCSATLRRPRGSEHQILHSWGRFPGRSSFRLAVDVPCQSIFPGVGPECHRAEQARVASLTSLKAKNADVQSHAVQHLHAMW